MKMLSFCFILSGMLLGSFPLTTVIEAHESKAVVLFDLTFGFAGFCLFLWVAYTHGHERGVAKAIGKPNRIDNLPKNEAMRLVSALDYGDASFLVFQRVIQDKIIFLNEGDVDFTCFDFVNTDKTKLTSVEELTVGHWYHLNQASQLVPLPIGKDRKTRSVKS